jgi:hypothetical protein
MIAVLKQDELLKNEPTYPTWQSNMAGKSPIAWACHENVSNRELGIQPEVLD